MTRSTRETRRTGAPVLETADLTVRFGGVVALAGVRLRILAGELRAIIGPNGAGKTTLFNAMTGAIRPSRGRVWLRGRDVTDLAPHRVAQMGIARTFQITNIFPELSVRENAWLGVNARLPVPWNPFAPADRLRALSHDVEALCVRVGLGDKLDEPAATLSHGDQRAVEIAIAMSLDPQILLLDEPTQGVSPDEVDRVIGLVSAIAESRTVLLIEHNVDVVLRVAHTVTVLDHGHIIAEGAPAEIVDDPRVREVYLGTARH